MERLQHGTISSVASNLYNTNQRLTMVGSTIINSLSISRDDLQRGIVCEQREVESGELVPGRFESAAALPSTAATVATAKEVTRRESADVGLPTKERPGSAWEVASLCLLTILSLVCFPSALTGLLRKILLAKLLTLDIVATKRVRSPTVFVVSLFP